MDYSREKRELFFMTQTYASLVSLANKIEYRANGYFKTMTASHRFRGDRTRKEAKVLEVFRAKRRNQYGQKRKKQG